MEHETLRRMCRQGDVEALDDLVRDIKRRNLCPQMTAGMRSSIEALMVMHFTRELSFAHTVELIHQRMIGVPLALTSLFFEFDEFNLFRTGKQKLRSHVRAFCSARDWPRPVDAPGGMVSHFTKNKKRGVAICFPAKTVLTINDIAIRIFRMLDHAGVARGRCAATFCCAMSREARWGEFEFIPEKGCEKTQVVFSGQLACGDRATIPRRGCWEWDGEDWRQV